MPYEAEISRANPTAFFFVLDQSGSMMETIAGGNNAKSAMLATVVNRILNDLVIRCTKGEDVANYFEIGLIGYGNDALGASGVGAVFGGALAGRDVVPIATLADHPIRIEKRKKKVDDGTGVLIDMDVEFPVWLEPIASSNTPMREAMSYTFQLVADWVTQHPNSFPPIVIHVTDGAPTDGDPRQQAEALRGLSTQDGNVLVFNLHLSAAGGSAILFPSGSQALPDDYARLLFDMSSEMPTKWMALAADSIGMKIQPKARTFVFNADLTAMVRFLEIGTRQPTQITT
jgi:hypothetical protein